MRKYKIGRYWYEEISISLAERLDQTDFDNLYLLMNDGNIIKAFKRVKNG